MAQRLTRTRELGRHIGYYLPRAPCLAFQVRCSHAGSGSGLSAAYFAYSDSAGGQVAEAPLCGRRRPCQLAAAGTGVLEVVNRPLLLDTQDVTSPGPIPTAA